MESTQSLNVVESSQVERMNALLHWLSAQCGLHNAVLQPMAGDASMRRYFRLHVKEQSFVVMDAPPPQENVHPFMMISHALRAQGLHAPEVFHAEPQQGFLLLTDLGDATYLRTLNADNADGLYDRALDALAVMQAICKVDGQVIPAFTADFMWKEWAWHKEWVLEKFLGFSQIRAEKELDACYQQIVQAATNQPQVFMHRDYHSGNLMVLPQERVGVLDFQDAFMGPVTYDLVSLLRDCYIDWPDEQVKVWALRYLAKLRTHQFLNPVSDRDFLYWFDMMGMQRHLKALLTFARKKVRDHQPHYLKHIPRTVSYLLRVSQSYPELAALHEYLQNTVMPALKQVMT